MKETEGKWQMVQPLTGIPNGVAVEAECLLLECKEYNLAHAFGQLARQHNSMCDVVRMYSNLRIEMRNILNTIPTEKDENVPGRFESALNAEQVKKLGPRIAELESLIDGMREHLKDYISAGEKLMGEIKPAAIRQFGDHDFPTLKKA